MTERTLAIIIMLFTSGLITTVFALTPYMIRKTDAFGVSVPEAQYQHPMLVAMRASYRNSTFVIGLLVLALSLASLLLLDQNMVIPIGLDFVLIGAIFANYVRFHKQAKALKAREGWQQNTVSKITVEINKDRIARVSPWWGLTYLLPIVTTFWISVAAYPGLPAKIPMQFDFSGQVQIYAAKSWKAVLAVPGTQALLALIFIGVLFSIAGSRVVIDPQQQEESLRRGNVFRVAWGVFLLIGGLLFLFLFLLLQLTILGMFDTRMASVLSLALPVVFLAGAMVLSFKVGQGGSRLKSRAPQSTVVSVRDDDRYWKLGSFYYNPDDPAVFVEKRFGVGWTCNMARPATYLLMLALAALTVCMILFIPDAVS